MAPDPRLRSGQAVSGLRIFGAARKRGPEAAFVLSLYFYYLKLEGVNRQSLEKYIWIKNERVTGN
jgi:hypothetical protein